MFLSYCVCVSCTNLLLCSASSSFILFQKSVRPQTKAELYKNNKTKTKTVSATFYKRKTLFAGFKIYNFIILQVLYCFYKNEAKWNTHTHAQTQCFNKTKTLPTSALKILTILVWVWLIADILNLGSWTSFEIVGKGQFLSLADSDVTRVKCLKFKYPY